MPHSNWMSRRWAASTTGRKMSIAVLPATKRSPPGITLRSFGVGATRQRWIRSCMNCSVSTAPGWVSRRSDRPG